MLLNLKMGEREILDIGSMPVRYHSLFEQWSNYPSIIYTYSQPAIVQIIIIPIMTLPNHSGGTILPALAVQIVFLTPVCVGAISSVVLNVDWSSQPDVLLPAASSSVEGLDGGVVMLAVVGVVDAEIDGKSGDVRASPPPVGSEEELEDAPVDKDTVCAVTGVEVETEEGGAGAGAGIPAIEAMILAIPGDELVGSGLPLVVL